MTNVKWLSRITVVEERFDGYQVVNGYRVRQSEDEEGRPVTRMRPRSLMVPPGMPDFLTRDRVVDRGGVELQGRAWSGRAPIARVEVSVDGGGAWADAALEPDPDHRWAWAGWTFTWEASAPGAFTLCCRATDETGETQPLEPPWNLGGYENNAVQRVPVVVR
jgi:DMSO/TMAO reductase YedYZ molybdopterin-dependent catalytic subunit